MLEGGTKEEVIEAIAKAIAEFKEWDERKRKEFAEAVYEEAQISSI